MKEENYLEGIYGCLERIEKKVETLPVEGTSPAVGNRTSSPEGIAELKIRLGMVLLKKEPERRLVTYRLESASKAVVTTASALILALIISVWTNCNQYRTNRLLKDADLKYRAIRICLPGDDPDIAFLEKHFTIKRDEEKIRRVERLVTAFEDSVRNRIRNHEMAAYKDSLAHRLFREAQEIRKQLDNPNSK